MSSIDVKNINPNLLKKAVGHLCGQYDPSQSERLAVLGTATSLLKLLKENAQNNIRFKVEDIDALVRQECLTILNDPRDHGSVLTAKLKASQILGDMIEMERQSEQRISVLADLLGVLCPSDLLGLIVSSKDLKALQRKLIEYVDDLHETDQELDSLL